MKSHNQGGLFQLELVSIVKLEGELAPDEVVLRVRNLALDPAIFGQVLAQVFQGEKVEIYAAFTKVTMIQNAESLRDQKSDEQDAGAFLEELAQRILDKLIKVPGWGDDEQLDHQLPYDLLD